MTGYLTDILDNIEEIEGYIAGLELDAFERDGLTRDAVERCLERVCEAASRLGERARALMPEQPWGDIGAVGDRLRHASNRISVDVIWNVVCRHLPGLKLAVALVLDRLAGDLGDG